MQTLGKQQRGAGAAAGAASLGCQFSPDQSSFFFFFLFLNFFLSALTISGEKVTSKNEFCGFATLH